MNGRSVVNRWIGACLTMLGSVVGFAAPEVGPYTPRSDDEVLERVPAGASGQEARRQRQALAEDPENLRDSIELARSYLATARVEGDVRFVGYAKAILSPWWEQPGPPAAVLTLRGTIRGAGWEWDRALADFRGAFEKDPKELGALRGEFEVQLSRGEVSEALAIAKEWPGERTSLQRSIVAARLGRMSGRAPEVYVALKRELEEAPSGDADERHAALMLLADLALQLGDREAAAVHFAALTTTGRRDFARLIAQSDYLLDGRRFGDMITLLKDEPPADPVLVRLGEAWLGAPDVPREESDRRRALLDQLEQRLEGRRKRDDPTVLPDEIRFRLRVRPDATLAGGLAKELWTARRELGDVRWVLEALRAAGNQEWTGKVVAWLRERSIEDARLAPLLDASGGRVGR